MIRTLPVVQKSLVLRRFCSAYSKNRTKDRASQKRTQAAFIDGIRPAARAASFPPFISASVPALLYPSNSIVIYSGLRLRVIPSTIPDQQPEPASRQHTTHKPAQSPIEPARAHTSGLLFYYI